jgi:20S proteasome alpha/beta subunit
MDTLLGIKGDGFVLLAADASAARSILVFKTDQDKIAPLDSHKLLAAAGPNADCSNLTEYVQKNMALYEFNNDLKLGTHAAANFIRRTLATALRKGPYQTNLLLGGFDEKDGASLYFIDYMGSMQKLNFGAQGYAANFTLSIFDREYKEGLSLAEAEEILEKAKKELAVRFLISQPKWIMKVVDKDGVRTL